MAASGTVALPPAPAPVRPRAVLVGSVLATGAAFVGVMAVIGIYLARRADVLAAGGTWLPDKADIPLTPSNMAFGTMLLSGLTLWWAVDAVRRGDRPSAFLAIGLTLLFGVAVINATVFIMKVSLIPVDTVTGVHFYGVVGAHLVMMIAGLLYVISQSLRVLAGDSGPVSREGLTGAAIFWTATIAAHGVIWIAVYIAK